MSLGEHIATTSPWRLQPSSAQLEKCRCRSSMQKWRKSKPPIVTSIFEPSSWREIAWQLSHEHPTKRSCIPQFAHLYIRKVNRGYAIPQRWNKHYRSYSRKVNCLKRFRCKCVWYKIDSNTKEKTKNINKNRSRRVRKHRKLPRGISGKSAKK